MNDSKVVLITGGARGIGWATAEEFLAAGWRVAIGDIDLVAAESRVRARDAALAVELDVADQRSATAAFDRVVRRFGRLDALVNNAGIQRWTPICNMDWNVWREVLDVNLDGVIRCLDLASRHMLRQGTGAVVNVVSVGAERGSSMRAPYCAAKAAVVGLTRTAAVEWSKYGVRVNAVGPGYVETDLVREFVESGKLEAQPLLERIPMGRMGRPEEIASTIRFLASDDASYITGQVLYVDGGFLAGSGVAAKAAEA